MNSVLNDNLEQLKSWIKRDICGLKNFEDHILIKNMDEDRCNLSFYTNTNEYSITLTSSGYFGGFLTSRITRPGEDWRRGHDLPDGEFSEELWKLFISRVMEMELCQLSSYIRKKIDNEILESVADESYNIKH